MVMTVDGEEKFVNYGADILETLGASFTGLWYRVNADGTRSLVKEGEAFKSLQRETYTSSPLLPKPEIEIDYINESCSVTLTEEEVPEGVDINDLRVYVQTPEQTYFAYFDMGGYSATASLGALGDALAISLPDNKEIPMTVCYALVIKDDGGNQTSIVYGEWWIGSSPPGRSCLGMICPRPSIMATIG